jgi:lysophospholipase L1-like esterase
MLFYVRAAALSPVLLPLGFWTRRTVPKLPEAPGDRQGAIGKGPSLRLLIAGDSSAAGVGAPHQDHALSGKLVALLEPDFSIQWQLHATSGHTTADTLARLEELPSESFDVAVTALGVNDAISMTSLRNWRLQQARLRQLLREKFGVRQLIVSGLPPIHAFPALPGPLRWHFGERATRLDRVLATDIAGEADTDYISTRFTSDISMMASDGFHPGPAVYAEWARRIADNIRRGRVC